MSTLHKITPTSPRLASLLSDVSRGNIKIPVFQRDFVWKDEQIVSLLDSIYRGYPVGSLLLWSTKQALKHERNIGGFKLPQVPEDYPVNYVLDGQQRLTTLYGVFNSDAQTDDPSLAQRFRICFLPDSGAFVHESATGGDAAINLRVILDTTKLLPQLAHFNTKQQTEIATLTERFKDYEFPVVTIKERTNQEVCRVFQRINSSGTTLSTLELLAAWTWSDQLDLRRDIDAVLERLSDKGYEDLDKSEVMRCLAAVVLNAIDTEALVDAKPDDLVSGMTTLKQAMHAAIDFLEKDILIKNVVFLPFPIMLVPLVRFFALELKPSAAQRTGLKKWFWHAAFTERYKAGTNRFVVDDLKKMGQLATGAPVFDTLATSVSPQLFRRTWRINSTAAKATICLLAQKHPRSFMTGATVDLSDTLSAYNAREFHHIYPKGFLASQGVQFHESNVIANICLLTSSDNNHISDDDPALYFPQVPDSHRDEVFARALIPSSFWDGNRPYGEFVAARAAELAKAAEALIANGSC